MKCGTENQDSRKFCGECSEALILACAECGSQNEPGVKFCGECGVKLSVAAPAAKRKIPDLEHQFVAMHNAMPPSERTSWRRPTVKTGS